MEHRIIEVGDGAEKSRLARVILESLPEWFGQPASLEEYVEGVRALPFWAAMDGERCLGFFCGKIHYGRTGDIYVCGVDPGCHRMGIGRELYLKLEEGFRAAGCEYAIVKTLSELSDYEPYARTRRFYRALGFSELLSLTEMWDEENPCLIMIKRLDRGACPPPSASG